MLNNFSVQTVHKGKIFVGYLKRKIKMIKEKNKDGSISGRGNGFLQIKWRQIKMPQKISDYETMYNMGWVHAHLLLKPVKTDNEAYMEGWNAYHETLQKLEMENVE